MKDQIEPHAFVMSKILGKSYCVKCGLIRLNNDFTDWAVRKGCDHTDDPGYNKQRKLTNPFK